MSQENYSGRSFAMLLRLRLGVTHMFELLVVNMEYEMIVE